MVSGEKPVIVSKNPSFNEVVDRACERLMKQQVQYSIQRIHEMQDYLIGLEQELDEFLAETEDK